MKPAAESLYAHSDLQPRVGIVLHANRHGQLPGARADKTIAVVHPVQHDEHGGPTLGPGRPLSPDEHAEVLEALASGADGGAAHGQFLPGNLLYHTAETVVWYMPSQTRAMHFRVRDDDQGTCVLHVRWPALVCCGRRGALNVAALARNQRPTPATPLYHAPLMNVYDNTGVCLGQMRPPSGTPISTIDEWEHGLVETAFTHVNHRRTLAASSEVSTHQLLTYWHERAGDGRAPKKKELVPLDLTLMEWIKAVTSGEQRHD